MGVPRLNLLSSPEVRQPGKAPNYSVNWFNGSTGPEAIDAMKGKEQEKATASRLAKISMFRRFLSLVEKSGEPSEFSRGKLLTITPNLKKISRAYNEAKASAADFQGAKAQLVDAFQKLAL